MTEIDQVTVTPAGLDVRSGSATTTLSWRWVRDHGEDPTSFDERTGQRRIYALGGPEPSAARSAELGHTDTTAAVHFTWDDHEPTWITVRTMARLLDPPPDVAAQPWSSPEQAHVTPVAVADVLADTSALTAAIRDLEVHGFARMTGFEGAHPEVDALAHRLGYPQTTIFGSTWELASDLDEHDDSAYSQSFLAPHTDGTYSSSTPGLQMFCCVERTGTGGESVVVDGLAIAETLRRDYPDDFDVLTTVPVPAHYREPGVELQASRPAIRLDQHGNFLQLSMNNYDRSPMHLPADQMAAFYRAYHQLHELANDQSRWLSIRLEPGDVLVNDNWRVLHGRLAYTGARRFFGCYIGHEAFQSRVRTLLT
jgi:trimethyllysine dioxygenase